MSSDSSTGFLTKQKVKNALANPGEIPPWVLNNARARWHRWRADDWEEYYLRMTDTADANPEAAVGPADMFETMREWQFSFLQEHGLESDDVVVDVGCGVLRGGIPLIEYLDAEHYYGLDIDEAALEDGRRRVRANDLQHKRPTLINNADLTFSELAGVEADFIWAQSVWTHLPPDLLEECIRNSASILADDGMVLATYHEGESIGEIEGPERAGVDYRYPFEHISELASEVGLSATRLEGDHPNDHDLVKLEVD